MIVNSLSHSIRNNTFPHLVTDNTLTKQHITIHINGHKVMSQNYIQPDDSQTLSLMSTNNAFKLPLLTDNTSYHKIV